MKVSLPIRKPFALMLALTLLIAGARLALAVSDRFALRETLIDGQIISEESSSALGLSQGENLFTQNLELVATIMCRRAGIGAATVEVVFPNRLQIVTNRFDPLFLAYDGRSGGLVGLDARGCVTPLSELSPILESKPLFVGLGKLKLFSVPKDFRVRRVVDALRLIAERFEKWSARISVVDFSQEDYLTVSFKGYEFQALVPTIGFDQALMTLFATISGAPNVFSGARKVDLRYNGLIISQSSKLAGSSLPKR